MSSDDSVDFEWIRRQLVAAVGRACPRRLADQREDIVQSALVRLIRILDREESPTTPSATYIWSTAYSVTLDELRSARHRRERPLDESEAEQRGAPPGSNPEEQSTARQLGRGVLDCLRGTLPERKRAVMLHYLGYKPREVAHMLGVSAKKISNLVYRGLDDLRRCLEAKGLTP